MNKYATFVTCSAILAFASICLADTPIAATALTPALGTVKKAGDGKFDFKRANHDLRLENVVMNAYPDNNGRTITGTFTLTHLYKAGPFKKRPADHILVSFTAKAGKTQSTVTPAKGKNPWGYIDRCWRNSSRCSSARRRRSRKGNHQDKQHAEWRCRVPLWLRQLLA